MSNQRSDYACHTATVQLSYHKLLVEISGGNFDPFSDTGWKEFSLSQ